MFVIVLKTLPGFDADKFLVTYEAQEICSLHIFNQILMQQF